MSENKLDMLMGPMRQAIRFFGAHFGPLTFIGLLYVVPWYLLSLYLPTVPSGLAVTEVTGAIIKVILLSLFVVMLFTPFRQAAQVYFLNAKFSGKSWTIEGTFWVGLPYWSRLFVANLIRLVLIVALVLIIHFSAGLTTAMAARLGIDIFNGMRVLASITTLVGATYIIVCLAYFDFLIVLEQQSALDAIKKSFQRVYAHSGKLLFHLLALSVFLVFILRTLNTLFDGYFLELMQLFAYICAINLVQVLCFIYFWNTRDVLNPEAQLEERDAGRNLKLD